MTISERTEGCHVVPGISIPDLAGLMTAFALVLTACASVGSFILSLSNRKHLGEKMDKAIEQGNSNLHVAIETNRRIGNLTGRQELAAEIAAATAAATEKRDHPGATS